MLRNHFADCPHRCVLPHGTVSLIQTPLCPTTKVASTSNTMYITDLDTAGAAKLEIAPDTTITVMGAVSDKSHYLPV